jgi:hypothetical protein
VDSVRLDSWTIHGGLNLHNAMSYGFSNLPPVADAGPDRTIVDSGGDGQELVTLDAGASSDSDGTIASYEWREGETVVGLVATAEVWLSVGTHTLTLTVTDDDGATATDSVVITVNPPPNVPPVANAGADRIVTDTNGDGFEMITLNGTASSDSDGTIVAYEWFLGNVVVATGATPTVSFPVGPRTLMLRVTDDDGATASDSVEVTVNAPPPPPPLPPPPASVHVGDLEGTAKGNKSAWTAHVTVTVHDGNHQLVVGATVTGVWNSGASGSGVCTTNSSGTCFVDSSDVRKRSATATFTVNGITVNSHVYNAAQNHDADGDSNGTLISVAKP